METAEIARVAVSAAPYSADKPYDYLVPAPLLEGAAAGVRVTVPFGRGNRPCEGLILKRFRGEKRPNLKPLSGVLDPAPVLDEAEIALALWMRNRYFCTFFEAAKTILPTGLWFRLKETWHLEPERPETLPKPVRRCQSVVDYLEAQGGSADWDAVRAACGEVQSVLRALEKAGVVRCETTAQRRSGDRLRRMAELAVSLEDALSDPSMKRSASRREVAEFLSSAGRASCADVSYFTGASAKLLRNMERDGLIRFTQQEELRLGPMEAVEPVPPGALNGEQQAAFTAAAALMEREAPACFLLHGVTGSGKTQVYLHLVQKALDSGKTAMVLVPEIILTPQMMEKFSSCFGDICAMLHSSRPVAERYDQWKRIRRGEARVVLGTRSAIFAPLKHLGLVILDEEQESSYQSELSPRYHTRDVAKYLCARDGALLLLGSATPTIETAWCAQQGQYHRAFLRNRYNRRSLPEVTVADLREEVRAGNAGIIGGILRRELEENLSRGEQSILFLNRRGSSRMLLCGECGHVPECPRCSVPMTYHSANHRLMCHYCGHSQRSFEQCPVCGGRMKHIGAGTQKVEEELGELFPGTGILRMDVDTAAGRHEEVLSRFEKERIPILLGTQMVAKGLDFENVTLVGVLLADLSLYVDHYRASERTFSLLTQVVGRAGRGSRTGRAVIQTYTPGNDVIQSAATQDYARFYDSEIRLRRLRRYPPFADLFTLTVSGIEEGAVLRGAARVRDTLRSLCERPGLARWNPEVLGPAPAAVLRVNNRFRYRVTLVGKNDREAREALSWLLGEFARDRANRGLHLRIECNGAD